MPLVRLPPDELNIIYQTTKYALQKGVCFGEHPSVLPIALLRRLKVNLYEKDIASGRRGDWEISRMNAIFTTGDVIQNVEPVSPVRFLTAVLAPLLISRWGLRKRSLDMSGAIAGLLVGFLLTVSNLCFFSALLTFFVAGSKVTKFRANQKKKLEDDFKEGGMRNWVQVLCNGGIAAEMAFLYMIDVGCTEKLIDFSSHFTPSWYSLAVLGALCCSCGDTFSSEIGSVIGSSREAILITNFKYVPRGTNGAVSLVGSLASVVGGALVGLAYYFTLLLLVNEDYLTSAPPQWPLVPIGGLLGLLGSSIDSILGATVQYSGYDKKRQCIVHHPGPGVEDICGSDIVDNHSVNLIASLFTSLLAPRIAFYLWK